MFIFINAFSGFIYLIDAVVRPIRPTSQHAYFVLIILYMWWHFVYFHNVIVNCTVLKLWVVFVANCSI